MLVFYVSWEMLRFLAQEMLILYISADSGVFRQSNPNPLVLLHKLNQSFHNVSRVLLCFSAIRAVTISDFHYTIIVAKIFFFFIAITNCEFKRNQSSVISQIYL